jgi:hypothetical protein
MSEAVPPEEPGSRSGADWVKALTATAAMIGAIATLLTALHSIGVLRRKPAETSPVPAATFASDVATPLFRQRQAARCY